MFTDKVSPLLLLVNLPILVPSDLSRPLKSQEKKFLVVGGWRVGVKTIYCMAQVQIFVC